MVTREGVELGMRLLLRPLLAGEFQVGLEETCLDILLGNVNALLGCLTGNGLVKMGFGG